MGDIHPTRPNSTESQRVRILLTGAAGQLGRELRSGLAVLGDVVEADAEEADFTLPDEIRGMVRDVAPKLIVNAAAYTAVDTAEAEENLAHRINAEAPAVMARACAACAAGR